jgi:hypothetical protein
LLDNRAADRSIRGIGGRTESVSLRGLAEVGRLCGEGPMSLGPLECKDNNAAYVKEIMPEFSGAAMHLGVIFWHLYS